MRERGAVAGGEDRPGRRCGSGCPRRCRCRSPARPPRASRVSGAIPTPATTKSAGSRVPSASNTALTWPSSPSIRSRPVPSRISTPCGSMGIAEEGRRLGRGHPAQDARRGLDQHDLQAPPRRHRRRLQPDVAAADDHQPRARNEAAAIASTSASVAYRIARPPDRRRSPSGSAPRNGPGGQRQPVVADASRRPASRRCASRVHAVTGRPSRSVDPLRRRTSPRAADTAARAPSCPAGRPSTAAGADRAARARRRSG